MLHTLSVFFCCIIVLSAFALPLTTCADPQQPCTSALTCGPHTASPALSEKAPSISEAVRYGHRQEVEESKDDMAYTKHNPFVYTQPTDVSILLPQSSFSSSSCSQYSCSSSPPTSCSSSSSLPSPSLASYPFSPALSQSTKLAAIQPPDPSLMQIPDYVGGSAYMLSHSCSERHAHELDTLRVFNPKAAIANEQFYTTSYWTKPVCDPNPFLGIKNFTIEGWFRWNQKEYGE